MKLDLSLFLDWLLKTDPEFLGNFITVIDKFIDEQMEGVEIPDTPDEERHNWLDDPLDGTYQITTSGISDEQLAAIREGIAGGMITEKAAQFLKGFLIALKIAL